MTPVSEHLIRQVLETDRHWCAYALADLDPVYAPDCEWMVDGGGVVLVYRGLEPPVLFAHGAPESTAGLLGRVPSGRYQYALMGVNRDQLRERLDIEWEHQMWRMVLQPGSMAPVASPEARRLSEDELPAVVNLTADHPDRPDAFALGQLANGVFYGLWEGGNLIAMAGTHVYSPAMSVAAIGNVFVLPSRRGEGLGTQVTSAVISHLIGEAIKDVILNVKMENEAAIHVYRKLGFWPYRGYYEGVAFIQKA